MNLIRLLLALIIATVALLCRTQAALAAERPNVVIILADDLGYADQGVHGCSDIPTPHMDSIARNGARFTDAYATSPICAPTRAGLLTGRYQQRFGFDDNGGPQPEEAFGIPASEITIAENLKAAGYVTGIVGKWDVGIAEGRRPNDRGFDVFFGFLPGANYYFPGPEGRLHPILRNEQVVDEPEYLTDAFARESVAFIERHAGRPFFLFVSFNAVHTPLEAPPKYMERFAELEGGRRTYAAMVSAMDDAIGQVLQALRDNGMENQTLVIFLSDNGGASGEGFAMSNHATNRPLRGRKGTFWEGGIRVPFFVSWPGRIEPGQVLSHMVSSLDVLPTALSAAEAPILSRHVLDGKDLLPLLRGQSETPPHDALYWRYHEHFAMRQGDWKLIACDGQAVQLFNLAEDIGETTDLAGEQPDRVAQLKSALDRWAKELPDPAWVRRRLDEAGRPQYIPLPIWEPQALLPAGN